MLSHLGLGLSDIIVFSSACSSLAREEHALGLHFTYSTKQFCKQNVYLSEE